MEERMDAGPLTAAVMTARGEDGTLSRQSFRRETAEGMDASDLTFRQVRLLGCRFLACDFRAAAFYDCVFQDCAFLSCRLARSFWKGAALTGCKAEGADLRKGRFKDCRLDRLRLRYANLNGALWERCALSDCDLAESACQELKVVKTTLHKTDFTGADLFRAVLKGADLSGCTLDGISLSASCQELRGAKIHVSQAAVVARILGIEVEG